MINLANKLTLLRMALAFIFAASLFSNHLYTRCLALFLFTGAMLTDLYDGRIARRRQMVTDFGKVMDPLADKILIMVALISLLLVREVYIPAWMVSTIIAREVGITVFRLLAVSKGIVLEAEKGGKQKTACQMATILSILSFLCLKKTNFVPGIGMVSVEYYFSIFVYISMLVTTMLTVTSGVVYLYRNAHLLTDK